MCENNAVGFVRKMIRMVAKLIEMLVMEVLVCRVAPADQCRMLQGLFDNRLKFFGFFEAHYTLSAHFLSLRVKE